jgi:hypothetical protein
MEEIIKLVREKISALNNKLTSYLDIESSDLIKEEKEEYENELNELLDLQQENTSLKAKIKWYECDAKDRHLIPLEEKLEIVSLLNKERDKTASLKANRDEVRKLCNKRIEEFGLTPLYNYSEAMQCEPYKDILNLIDKSNND